jgi:hypothetical protein
MKGLRLLKVDWEELEEAFRDASVDHRYYLDRDTGQVHFFSTYLDNEEEQKDEGLMTAAAERYVPIPLQRRLVSLPDIRQFVRSLDRRRERALLEAAIAGEQTYDRFGEALERLPEARRKWLAYHQRLVRHRLRDWLAEVGVEPID